MKNLKNRGITLIALVITIIILIILAGIAISSISGDNGLFSRAREAKYETEKSELKEKLQIEALSCFDTNGKFDINKCEENIKNNLKIPNEQIGYSPEGTIIVSEKDYSFEITKDGNIIETHKEGEVFNWDEYTFGWISDTSFIHFIEDFNKLIGRPYPDNRTLELSSITGFTKLNGYDCLYTCAETLNQSKEYYQSLGIDTLIIGTGYTGDIAGADEVHRMVYEEFKNYPVKDIGAASDNTSETVINDFRDAIKLIKSALPDMDILVVRTYPWDYEQIENIYKVSIGTTEEQFNSPEIQNSLKSTINRANTLYTELEKACEQLGVEYLDLSTYTSENRDTFFDAGNVNLTDAAREVLIPNIVDKIKKMLL